MTTAGIIGIAIGAVIGLTMIPYFYKKRKANKANDLYSRAQQEIENEK